MPSMKLRSIVSFVVYSTIDEVAEAEGPKRQPTSWNSPWSNLTYTPDWKSPDTTLPSTFALPPMTTVVSPDFAAYPAEAKAWMNGSGLTEPSIFASSQFIFTPTLYKLPAAVVPEVSSALTEYAFADFVHRSPSASGVGGS